MKFTTEGGVRGPCGHIHKSESAAVRCIDADSRVAKRQGGYSDRFVVPADAEAKAWMEEAGVDRLPREY
jgi:hypothetical protein